MAHRMLVVAAHMGDFVWRCGGSIAKYIQDGSEVQVLVLSSGIRGEANDYWKQPGASRGLPDAFLRERRRRQRWA